MRSRGARSCVPGAVEGGSGLAKEPPSVLCRAPLWGRRFATGVERCVRGHGFDPRPLTPQHRPDSAEAEVLRPIASAARRGAGVSEVRGCRKGVWKVEDCEGGYAVASPFIFLSSSLSAIALAIESAASDCCTIAVHRGYWVHPKNSLPLKRPFFAIRFVIFSPHSGHVI